MRLSSAAPFLLAFLGACSVPSVIDGINPVVACLSDNNCPRGWSCQQGGCQANPRVCASNVDCAVGESCQPNSLCNFLPDSGLDCPATYVCQPAEQAYCTRCTTDSDCASSFCVSANANGIGFCTQACGAGCPSGASCQSVQGPDGGSFQTCLPSSGGC